tara:strand:- start:1461 stop:2090 length:630 start_codon:yes stop_codon:yes gene_type:complete
MQRGKIIKIVFLWLFRSLLVLAGTLSVLEQNWMNLFLLVLTLGLTFIPTLLEKKLRVDYPEEFELIILLFIFASMFLGEIHLFYQKFWWWDVMLHGFSAIILGQIAFSLIYILNREGKIKLKPSFIALFAFCFALSAGVLWEIFEFLIDYFLKTNMQKSGLIDTMVDLIIDFIGAFLVSAIGYFYLKGKLKFLDFIRKDFIKANPDLFK